MKVLKDIWEKKGDIHHAYLMGDLDDEVLQDLSSFLKKMVPSKESEVQLLKYETFGIDEARALRTSQTLSSIETKQFFILNPKTITVEAQNALLKVFEDPARDTHFFLCVEEGAVLPTLRSRMIVVSSTAKEEDDIDLAKSYLKSSVSGRLQMVRDIVDAKDIPRLETLLTGLETILREDVISNKQTLKQIQSARRYLKNRGSNLKLLLENLVLVS
ncbi:hypothetical protein CL654_00345 [bacterium]|nr:hypothetical protein [bacterium]|tara:strand:+ start:8222 stop:8869 length:648 start_codon:yes stop_codon:yes gene_type:complete